MSSDFMPQELDSLLASQRASVYGSSKTGSSDNSWMEDYEIHQKGEDMGLDFTDYLQLMVQQLQNQTMDNTTDTSDMLNQLVQMSVVQMMTTVKTSIDTLVDANTLTYAASLVGKTVTVGEYGEDGKAPGGSGNRHRDRDVPGSTSDLCRRRDVRPQRHHGGGDPARYSGDSR